MKYLLTVIIILTMLMFCVEPHAQTVDLDSNADGAIDVEEGGLGNNDTVFNSVGMIPYLSSTSGNGGAFSPISIMIFDGTNVEVQDNENICFGGDADWCVSYQTGDATLYFDAADATVADVVFRLDDTNTDATFTITNTNGSYEANVDLEGDLTMGGTLSGLSSMSIDSATQPILSFDDSNTTEETTDASLSCNATDASAGTEDVDMYMLTLINGLMQEVFHVDIQGTEIELGSSAASIDVLIESGNLYFGNQAATIGNNTEDSITIDTDGTGDGELVLPDDSVGVSEIAPNAIDSDAYVDYSIDHEHLANDVINGMTEVTSEDADYILIWDSSDSGNLKKVDMGEVRGGSATAYDDIGDPDAAGSISFDNAAYTGTYTSGVDGWGGIIISNTQATITTAAPLFTLQYTDSEGDATGEIDFIKMIANSVTLFEGDEDGIKIGSGSPTNSLDGGDLYVSDDAEFDGDVTVDGTLSGMTSISVDASATPTVTFDDSGGTGTDATIVADSSDANDATLDLNVKEDTSLTSYVQLDGVYEDVEFKKKSVFESTMFYGTVQMDFSDTTEDYVLTYNAATDVWSGEASQSAVTNYITDDAADVMSASTDGTTELIIRNTDGDLGSETYLLELQHTDDADANGDFIKCTDAYGGSPATLFNVEYNGNTTSAGTVSAEQITSTDDLSLNSDAGIINFGVDSDVRITHDTDDGLTIGTYGLSNNESINIDFETTADTIEITSPSSATTVDFNTLAMVTTGIISGRIEVTPVSTTHAVTAREASGGWLLVTAAVDVDLIDCSAANVGAVICVEQGDDDEVVSVAVGDSSDDILYQGTLIGTNSELDSPGDEASSTRGAYACFICTEADLWRVKGSEGTWVDGGTVD